MKYVIWWVKVHIVYFWYWVRGRGFMFPHDKYVSPWHRFRQKIKTKGAKYRVTGWRRFGGIPRKSPRFYVELDDTEVTK